MTAEGTGAAPRQPHIDDLLAQMTLEEKVAMCHANRFFTSAGCPRLGIPDLVMADGPHGVYREEDPAESDDDGSTALPTGIALAATWDTDLARRFGEVLGAEAASRGKHVLLGPAVNIQRTPLCGRTFEYMGEDPLLTASLAAAYIRGVQSRGVAACIKHLAVNNQELDRRGVNVDVDDRALRELYLPAFETAVREAGVLTVMSAYNRFRGRYCSQHPWLLDTLLKAEWGFEGAVISDWGAVTNTAQAAETGIDIEMGCGPDYDNGYLAAPYLEGLKEGRYPPAALDDKVRRVLRVMDRLGLLPGGTGMPTGARNTPQHRDTARQVAESSFVLLKNTHHRLPLDLSTLRTLAVIGDNATARHCYGGGSSRVRPPHEVTPLEGLRARLGKSVRILHARGYPDNTTGDPLPLEAFDVVDAAGIRGWRREWFDNFHFREPALYVDTAPGATVDARRLPRGIKGRDRVRAVRWSATFTPPVSGSYVFTLKGTDWSTVLINDRRVHSLSLREASLESRAVQLEAGNKVRIQVQACLKHEDSILDLGCLLPNQAQHSGALDEALTAAAEADAVVFFGGLNHQHDTEAVDRYDLTMPPDQDRLVRALGKANPNLVVVLLGSGSVELPWIDDVDTVLQAWYPGQEGGHALARVLCGDVDAGGRLPFSWPRRLGDTPVARYGDYAAGHVTYREGLRVGYRDDDDDASGACRPLFPFGHGLSYTSFAWTDLELETLNTDAGPDDALLRVSCRVHNRGARAGTETVQCYVADPEASLPRPPLELKAFAKVRLDPGQDRRVTMELNRRAFAFWMPGHGWVAEPGRFHILLGASARDIRLRGDWDDLQAS